MSTEEPAAAERECAGPGEGGSRVCRDWLLGACARDSCRYLHVPAPPQDRRGLLRFCYDYQNRNCNRGSCKFVHCTVEEQEAFLRDGVFPQRRPQMSVPPFNWLPPPALFYTPGADGMPYFSQSNNVNGPSDKKFMRFSSSTTPEELRSDSERCSGCVQSEHSIKLLHENFAVLLEKYNELKMKNANLTKMNEFLLEQGSSRERDGVSVMTSRTAAPVSLATVSMTPIVSLSELVPAAASAGLALNANTSRTQIITQAPQLLAVSTTQPLMTNSGALIVTSTGAHQLMQASAPATLVGGGQAVVAVAPAQLMANPSPATVQLVQHSAQLAVAQQSAQHLHQSAQHLAAAQQSVQHLPGAQHSAQHLQKSAQYLAAAQHLAAAEQSAQQLVHASSAQITISSVAQPITQTRLIPMISQNMLPH